MNRKMIWHTALLALVASGACLSSAVAKPHDIQADTWTAIDALGRSLPGYSECGPRKADRTVAMFYFVTHNQNGANRGPYNVTEIMAVDPVNPHWGGGTHYWGEPEQGYYIMQDEWVIRRHARMLTDAGVDVIVLDNTNDVIYPEVFHFIAKVFRKMRAEGEPTPQIACLASERSVQMLWDQIYSRGLYAELWFQWKGKPLLMFGQHIIGDRKQMNDVQFAPAITDFFTIRQAWAWTTLRWYDDGHDEWPWIDHYPQAVGWHESPARAEYVPVAVAEHPLSNIGRSFFDGVEPPLDQYGLTPFTAEGRYFGQQWQRALEVDPELVFVTGWNEWTAGQMTRSEADYTEEMRRWNFFPGARCGREGHEVKMGESYFIDQYNQEFSRDIEPMKGGHTDNYYYQLMANVRRYKGVDPPVVAGAPQTIDLDGAFDQWVAVEAIYYDHKGDTYHRNAPGNFAAGPYVDTTGRNDMVECRVARDDRSVVFYVQTAEVLSPYTDPLWMLLFIDTDANSATGWQGYDLLLNAQVVDDHTTMLKRYDQGAWHDVQQVEYRTEGNRMMVSVPRTMFPSTKLLFDFHWADGIQKLDDINELLLHGDQAPSRRANYRYAE